jgi:hypothetical protein
MTGKNGEPSIIKVTDERVRNCGELYKRHRGEVVECSDGIKFQINFPHDPKTGFVTREVMDNMGDIPFVWVVDELTISDPEDHYPMLFSDVPIIFLHGDFYEGTWCIGEKPAKDVLGAVDKYCLENGLPPVRLIVACNIEAGSDGQPVIPKEGSVIVRDIKKDRNVAQVAGDWIELIPGKTAILNDKTYMQIHPGKPGGFFFGLHYLVDRQEKIAKQHFELLKKTEWKGD